MKGQEWVALVIGNTRLHWGFFVGRELQFVWDTPHIASLAEGMSILARKVSLRSATPDLWIASVVPQQTELWAGYARTFDLTLKNIPLNGMYATLGIDRALAAWSASKNGAALVMDAGTALTFTGVDSEQSLIGGAILPGLGLQLRSLSHGTAALPLVESLTLPDRWARDTQGAITSGILYTLVAGIESFVQDWQKRFPGSNVVLTGGDGELLLQSLRQVNPVLANSIQLEPNLVLLAIAILRNQPTNLPP